MSLTGKLWYTLTLCLLYFVGLKVRQFCSITLIWIYKKYWQIFIIQCVRNIMVRFETHVSQLNVGKPWHQHHIKEQLKHSLDVCIWFQMHSHMTQYKTSFHQHQFTSTALDRKGRVEGFATIATENYAKHV